MIGGTFYHAGNPRSAKVAEAWQQATGCECVLGGTIGKPPHVFYGVKRALFSKFKAIAASGDPWLYVDNGYFPKDADGFRRYSIAARALRYEGPIDPDDYGRRRFDQLGIQIQPWRKSGSHILAALQSSWWYTRHGTSWFEWESEVLNVADELVPERAVIARYKPKELYKGRRLADLQPPLDHHLKEAWATVSHSSNVATDAILAGIPSYVQEHHPASLLGFTDLRQLVDPPLSDQRLPWAQTLAGQQWSLEEIANGEPIERLIHQL